MYGGSHVLWGNPIYGAVSFMLCSIIFTLLVHRKGDRGFHSLASYRVFSNMVFYAILALNLGGLMCLCHELAPFTQSAMPDYLAAGAWILMVAAAEWGCNLLLSKRKIAIGFGSFLSGALIWIASDWFIFHTSKALFQVLWTFLWGIGIALVSAGLRYFADAFEAVGVLEGGKTRESLEQSNHAVMRSASLVSSLVMIAVLLLWIGILPSAEDGQFPLILRILQIQLPLIPMIIAVFAALNQPLDARSYEKLMNYLDGGEGDPRVRENLMVLFVRKYRVRYVIRILSSIVRPFLRLKVSGEENLKRGEYPSVFVCNHGFIYGPISAVVYLPTYFRPWIHDAMLDKEKTAVELAFSFPRLPRAAIRAMASLVCKVLNSCDPIPVVRGNSRDVMTTLHASLDALAEGDNLLIFPELPNSRTRDGKAGAGEEEEGSNLRNFFTGFAHIGKMYFEKTGQSLLFYPLYTDATRREFRIGEPVRYDPTLPSRESKTAIAEELHSRMVDLKGEPMAQRPQALHVYTVPESFRSGVYRIWQNAPGRGN